MDVFIYEEEEYDINLGDLFYNNDYEEYLFFSPIGNDYYALIPTTFDTVYQDFNFNGYDRAITELAIMVKNGSLKLYSKDEYIYKLRVEKR